MEMDNLFELPALVGSDKQIAWAERVRTEKLDSFKAMLLRYQGDAVDSETLKLKADPNAIFYVEIIFPEVIQPWMAENVFNQTSAKWWIDNRDTNFNELAAMENRTIVREKRKAKRNLGMGI